MLTHKKRANIVGPFLLSTYGLDQAPRINPSSARRQSGTQ